MSRPKWWAVVSSLAAMVFLVGGWVAAQAAQPPGYDPIRQTISALARDGLDHRWIMTLGLAGLGVAHMVTALGLSSLRWWSRLVLALGGAATLAVSIFAQPYTGSSSAHLTFATIGFVALTLWPATTSTRDAGTPAPVRPFLAVTVTLISAGLLIWFATTLSHGPVGLTERLLSFQQALWPFVVVLGLRRARPRVSSPGAAANAGQRP